MSVLPLQNSPLNPEALSAKPQYPIELDTKNLYLLGFLSGGTSHKDVLFVVDVTGF